MDYESAVARAVRDALESNDRVVSLAAIHNRINQYFPDAPIRRKVIPSRPGRGGE